PRPGAASPLPAGSGNRTLTFRTQLTDSPRAPENASLASPGEWGEIVTRGTESGKPTDVDARTLHDAFAAPLYRYAWSLLGGDGERAAEAVHDALVAGVALDGERATRTERAPWLYALPRTACQLRGLATTSPYTNPI